MCCSHLVSPLSCSPRAPSVLRTRTSLTCPWHTCLRESYRSVQGAFIKLFKFCLFNKHIIYGLKTVHCLWHFMSTDAVSSLSGFDSDARRTYRILPGWHSISDGWPHDPEAHHISCGSSSAEPHVWQGERTYLDLWVITETRLNLKQTGMCKSEGKK